jgi:hypothetical protein
MAETWRRDKNLGRKILDKEMVIVRRRSRTDKSEAVSGSGPARCPAAMALLAGRGLAVWMALRRHRQPCQKMPIGSGW